jgi:hypothetical protein
MGRIFQKLEANKRTKMEEMEKLAREAQMEAMQALVADLPDQVPNLEKGVASNERELFGVRATQMEAMQTLIGHLPRKDGHDDCKGKGVDIPNWLGNEDDDDWGDDELLYDGDSG